MAFAPTADQQTALDELLVRQQTAGSPDYHRWLSPEEYARRRAAYVRAGKGTPPPGATPLPSPDAPKGDA